MWVLGAGWAERVAKGEAAGTREGLAVGEAREAVLEAGSGTVRRRARRSQRSPRQKHTRRTQHRGRHRRTRHRRHRYTRCHILEVGQVEVQEVGERPAVQMDAVVRVVRKARAGDEVMAALAVAVMAMVEMAVLVEMEMAQSCPTP